jgi:hypothetical protein
MTSPAICLYGDGEWSIRFLTQSDRFLGQRKYKSKLGIILVTGDPYKEHNSPEERFDNISEWAMACIDDPNGKIVIEDYAMGSKGKVFHIAENCGLLKYKLWREGFKFNTIPPSALKKFATGKGNSDKDAMHKQFVFDTGIDLMFDMMPKAKNCASPVSDVVDAFYLTRYAQTLDKS